MSLGLKTAEYLLLIVTPQGFEPRLSGPKPLVLPLDERVIYL